MQKSLTLEATLAVSLNFDKYTAQSYLAVIEGCFCRDLGKKEVEGCDVEDIFVDFFFER